MRLAWPLDLPVLAALLLLPLGACALDDSADAGDPAGEGDDESDDGSGDPDGPAATPAAFATCTALPYAPGAPQGFEHLSNELVAAGGGPTHHAQDVVVRADQPATASGVFQYSILAVDIADEVVRVSLDTCDGWRDLGSVRTDDDGRAAVAIDEPLPPGVYHLVFEVTADATLASAYLWSLPAGTRMALFDIDGTLTSSNSELWKEILLGDYVPEPTPSAANLTAAHADRGHIAIYLGARPSALDATTRAWLDDLDFAHGAVQVTDRASQMVPTNSGVGAFKRDFIRSLLDAGLLIDVAYGSASTDIFAYLAAGLPADRVWIIGESGGQDGTHAVADSWTARTAEVASGPPVEQPFVR